MRRNSGPRQRKDIWGFCAAQEYTQISPEFHEEFMFRYQLPICEHFGLAACRGGYSHIYLKDIETVQGDVSRLTRWVQLVRDISRAY